MGELELCNVEEYIGGLCDLTGEVGRVAVSYGTKRESEEITNCLATNLSILNSLEELNLSSKLYKKLGPLQQSISKLETMLYEISLINAKGGGVVSMDASGDVGMGGENEKD